MTLKLSANIFSAINGKVDIAQGTDNAGRVLGINSSGNVEPITVSSGNKSLVPSDYNLTSISPHIGGSGFCGISDASEWVNYDVLVIQYGDNRVVDLEPYKSVTSNEWIDLTTTLTSRSGPTVKNVIFPLTIFTGMLGFYAGSNSVGMGTGVVKFTHTGSSTIAVSYEDASTFRFYLGTKK